MAKAEIRGGMRVRLVRSRTYPTKAEFIGLTGRILDQDGDVFYVRLDQADAIPGGRYWALADEMEPIGE
jgi:hypothetical protein